jgi:hypothetical protein
VAKLTDAGASASFTWVQQAGGNWTDEATALAVSGTSVYVAGHYISNTADFGSITLTNASSGLNNLFVAKLTDAGPSASFIWAQQAGGPAHDYATGLAVQGSSVYVAGSFYSSTISFGSTTMTLTNPGGATGDAFVAKLTDAGNTAAFTWAQQMAGGLYDQAQAVAVSGSSVYVAGNFDSHSMTLGSITLTNVPVNGEHYELFVAKLTDAGPSASFTWAQQAGGDRNESVAALVASGSEVFMAGTFESTPATFGTTLLSNAAPSTSYSPDIFVAKLTDAGSTGSFTWAQQAGGVNSDLAWALVLAGPTVYVAGSFGTAPARFGPFLLASVQNTLTGFLAALNRTALATTSPASLAGSLSLAPNPARGSATLALPAAPAARPVRVLDALGRAVAQATLPAHATTTALDLRCLAPGLYTVRCGPASGRLVVE